MAVPCLCDALLQDDGDGESPSPGASPYGWSAGVPARLARDDGSAPHLAAMRAEGVSRLIDAHSHWFPESVERKIWAYFDRHYWPVTYRTSHHARLEWMARNGVERFTVLTYAHRPGMAAWLNDWVANFAADLPAAIPCGTFYPEPGAGEIVRRCIEQYGFRGFKLHLQVSEFDPTSELLTPAFEQLEEAGLPVVMHIGSAPLRGRFTSPAYLRRLLGRHPRLRVVIAHMGAVEFETYLALAERNDNVYLDTTMVFVGFDACGGYPSNLLRRLEGISGQVLFGSDFPTIPYPLSHAVAGVLGLPFSGAAKQGILAGNAARVFGAGAP
jgi:predicted TIM-barrel fold metal-dependent hydrolase